MLAIKKILHPTDYSDLSKPAFEMACSLARDFGAELVICHVAPPPIIAIEGQARVEIPSDETELMQRRLESLKPDSPRIAVTHKLLRGNPAEEIVSLAADMRVDLIVMGTHGRGGLSRLVMGSAAEGVMRKAPCPVVTVKVPAKAAAA